MRITEIIKETTEREIRQAVYMEGQCSVLAIAIHQANPQRYMLGYVYEYNVPGVPDMWLDPHEFNTYSRSEKQEVMSNHQHWGLVHAYVFDQETKEYIDARGRHKTVPTLWTLDVTRKNVFPAKPKDIIRLSQDMTWDDAKDEWHIVRGAKAYATIGGQVGHQQALDYAVKHLGIEPIDKQQ